MGEGPSAAQTPRQWVDHIVLDEVEPRVADKMGDIFHAARQETVDAHHAQTLCDQPIAQMRTDEAGTAGHQRNPLVTIHFRLPTSYELRSAHRAQSFHLLNEDTYSFSVSSGTILNRSPTRPMSATWKIGASSSLLMATIVFESFIPARCWIAPEMPIAI